MKFKRESTQKVRPMDESDNLNELRQELQQKKKEIVSLRSKFNFKNKEKEDIFKQLRSSRDKVKSRLEMIKNLKKERDKFNEEVKISSSQQKKVEVKKDFREKRDPKDDPRKLKAMIEHMEKDLEISVMPFNKEQKNRKQLKELKTKYKTFEKEEAALKEFRVAGVDFSKARKRAQESHHKVQEKAEKSQEKHEKINVLYEEIKKLREGDKPLADEYLKHKKEYEEIKPKIEELQKRVNELSKLFDERREKTKKVDVKEKTEAVREKIKKGKKVRTEDILAFQATNED